MEIKKMKKNPYWKAFLCLWLLLSCAIPSIGAGTLEAVFKSDDNRWKQADLYKGALPEAVTLEGHKGYKFPCDFSLLDDERPREKCCWDLALGSNTLDLSKVNFLSMKIFVEQAQSYKNCVLYFKSGEGWYNFTLPHLTEGWNDIKINFQKPGEEGTPIGLKFIDGIRLGVFKKIGEIGVFTLIVCDVKAEE